MGPRELALRRTLPLVLNSFNQYSYLRGLLERFEAAGFRNLMVLDNGSSYPPLLDYLNDLQRSGRALVIYYGQNRGPHWFFQRGLYRQLFDATPFLYSDPDLELPSIADDFVTRLLDITHSYRDYKAGCALTLPTAEQMKPDLLFDSAKEGQHSLHDWERRFWEHPLAADVYNAPIDTTLHLFNPAYFPKRGELVAGIRVAGPGFEARHLPWFKDDPCPEHEWAYYRQHARFANW